MVSTPLVRVKVCLITSMNLVVEILLVGLNPVLIKTAITVKYLKRLIQNSLPLVYYSSEAQPVYIEELS